MQTTVDSQVIVNSHLTESDGKIWADTSWLRLWPKNPRTIQKSNLAKLEKQILELGVYKPLVVTPDGEILGGNQRFKVISELSKKDKRFEKVWVSVVEAWTDVERLKYALSDNFSAGEYTREKLQEVVNLDQVSMFDSYDVSFEDKQTIQQFVNDLALTESEITFSNVKKNLKTLGINDETIKTLETMTTFSKINEDLADVDIKGCITGQKSPMLFWFDDVTMFEQFKEVYGTGHKDKYNTEKLIENTEKVMGVKFPTTEDELMRLVKEIATADKDLKDSKELGGDWQKIEDKKGKSVEAFKQLFSTTYPQEASEVLF